jgi:hypothetical protein
VFAVRDLILSCIPEIRGHRVGITRDKLFFNASYRIENLPWKAIN